ncbi:MAG: hypothetical protein WHV64_09685 [Geminicoccaceae bacterium]
MDQLDVRRPSREGQRRIVVRSSHLGRFAARATSAPIELDLFVDTILAIPRDRLAEAASPPMAGRAPHRSTGEGARLSVAKSLWKTR